jgi:hypothetical protein
MDAIQKNSTTASQIRKPRGRKSGDIDRCENAGFPTRTIGILRLWSPGRQLYSVSGSSQASVSAPWPTATVSLRLRSACQRGRLRESACRPPVVGPFPSRSLRTRAPVGSAPLVFLFVSDAYFGDSEGNSRFNGSLYESAIYAPRLDEIAVTAELRFTRDVTPANRVKEVFAQFVPNENRRGKRYSSAATTVIR